MKENIQELVKDPEWQRVRQSLLGQWKTDPEWCCLQLKHYLGNIKTTSDDKLRIVGNYLTGTGFRTGAINAPCSKILRYNVFLEIRRRRNR